MIRGTTHDQDSRFVDKNKKMLEKSQWPDKYDINIDLSKVDMQLMNLWIQNKITSILGEEDDIISGTIISLLEQYIEKSEKPNAKQIHVAISGFLADQTLTFMSQLWDLLDQAQKSSRGIPQCLLQEKKAKQTKERKKLQELKYLNDRLKSKKFDQRIRDRSKKDTHERRSREKDKKHKKKHHEESKKKKKHRRGSSEHQSKKNQDGRSRSREKQKAKSKNREEAEQSSEVIESSSNSSKQ